jgi:glycosyltransferase involved in cell wall biosynthesis
MRLMYLSASGELGGAERVLLALFASIRRAEPSWPMHLLSPAGGPLTARAAELGVTTVVLPFPTVVAGLGESATAGMRGRAWRLAARLPRAAVPVSAYVARLRAAVRAFHPDVLHTNGLKMHVLGSWACPAPTRVLWHIHDYVGSRPMTARLLRWSVSRCAAIVANSMSVADDVRATLGEGVAVVPVHNGIDLERFSVSGDCLDLDSLAGMQPAPPGVVRVGLLGTFARWKGHATFLDAVARLPRDLPIRAYVIGGALYQTEGSQYSIDELRALAANLGLTDRVGFVGFAEHPDAVLRALDIVVHASTAPEPFGLVIAEAMACGRAVVVSDAGGAREVITAGVDALVHTPGDGEGLAARIATLAVDAELRARIGRAGRATAERRFDQTRLAGDLLSVYRSVAPFA